MKKLCLLLVIALFLSGCSGDSIPTQPTTTEPLPSGSTAPTVPTTTAPAEQPFMIPDEFSHCEIVTPEDGVLILHGEETIQDKIIVGDVYITANAEVSFSDVYVKGNIYCHGKLTTTGYSRGKHLYAYKESFGRSYEEVCSAYDGVHGEVISFANGGISTTISLDALDYAFETWGKVEPIAEPLKEIRPEKDAFDWDKEVRILSGKQSLVSETIEGDVYITSDGDITFYDVHVRGNVYVYGKLHFSDYGTDRADIRNSINCRLYAYDFGISCEAFDGVHGQVTGGPVVLTQGYVIADDALDYAFETWGKQ